MFAGRQHSGAIVPLVVSVGTVKYDRYVLSFGKLFQLSVEFVLAMIAAIGRVTDILPFFELVRGNHFVANADLLGDRSCIIQFTRRKASADAGDRDRAIPKRQVRGLRHDGTIHST
jgi:hypothetical protein